MQQPKKARQVQQSGEPDPADMEGEDLSEQEKMRRKTKWFDYVEVSITAC